MNKEEFSVQVFNYLHLIALYLNKKDASNFKIDENNLSFFANLSKCHSLLAVLYKAISDTKAAVKEEYLKKLEEYYLVNVRKDVLFEKERKALFAYLNDNQIDYLPLKGIIIRDYYLDPHSREYADNDVLFLSSKDTLVKEYFVKNGYKVELFRKSNHDVYQKKPFFNFEMHRELFGETDDNEKIIAYFNNYLAKAPIKEGYEHYLSKEDFYIYFTAHSYKHYHVSGCGIRTLIDYYLYLKNNELDFDYINQELEKIDLADFSNKISSLSLKVFDEQELTNEEKEMVLYIASSGTYGTLANSVSRGVKEKGKFRYFMHRVFPPYSFYKSAYPWAYKCVILIPLAWFMRLLRILFKNPKKAKRELELISQSKDEKDIK